MSYLDILKTQLTVDEGSRLRPYTDTVGKITIGIGRNLSDVGISKDEQDLMFQNDVFRADAIARDLFPTFDDLTDNRKAVLCNMAFNLGKGSLSSFVLMISAVNQGDYATAADRMLKSLWAIQVGGRATRLSNLMRSG